MNQTSQDRSAQSAGLSVETPKHISDELRRYDEHLRDVRGLTAGTRRNRCRVISYLLQQKFARRDIDMAKLRPDDVRRFLARQLERNRSHSHALQLATALRTYLRYRAVFGDSVRKLTAAIASPVQ